MRLKLSPPTVELLPAFQYSMLPLTDTIGSLVLHRYGSLSCYLGAGDLHVPSPRREPSSTKMTEITNIVIPSIRRKEEGSSGAGAGPGEILTTRKDKDVASRVVGVSLIYIWLSYSAIAFAFAVWSPWGRMLSQKGGGDHPSGCPGRTSMGLGQIPERCII
ncbi:hypothetical protein IW262DRAFT_1467634 [Armillaria fumosa]|nr:hypothetical protein IW262DRAFT_1467634 [Armillaria fumosa]